MLDLIVVLYELFGSYKHFLLPYAAYTNSIACLIVVVKVEFDNLYANRYSSIFIL